MTGIIDVGGGLRGIYGAGVFDRCIDEKISFDCCIGVSAGSANVASFVAGQKGRNYKFYAEYCFRKDYMGVRNFIRHGSFLGLDYIYGELSNSGGENPLDYEAFSKYNGKLITVATDALTGEPVYLSKDDYKKDNYAPLCASSCLPIVCKPYNFNSKLYFDGGISDPVPLKKAFEIGCDRVILILTKPVSFTSSAKRNSLVSKLIRSRYPFIAEKLKNMSEQYSRSVAEALKLQNEGKVLIIAPETIEGMKTLTKDTDKLSRLYLRGYKDADKIFEFISDSVFKH